MQILIKKFVSICCEIVAFGVYAVRVKLPILADTAAMSGGHRAGFPSHHDSLNGKR